MKLSTGSQHQFFYVLTNPARTESGLFRMSKQTMFWRTHTNKTHFSKLTASPLIEWDDEKDLVWITSALDPRYFKQNPNKLVSVGHDMGLHYPHRFVDMLHERYGRVYSEIRKAYQRLSKG